jgi:hypothetical protein
VKGLEKTNLCLNYGLIPSGGWWLYSAPPGTSRFPIGSVVKRSSTGEVEGSALSWVEPYPGVSVKGRSVAYVKKKLLLGVEKRVEIMDVDELAKLRTVGGDVLFTWE